MKKCKGYVCRFNKCPDQAIVLRAATEEAAWRKLFPIAYRERPPGLVIYRAVIRLFDVTPQLPTASLWCETGEVAFTWGQGWEWALRITPTEGYVRRRIYSFLTGRSREAGPKKGFWFEAPQPDGAFPLGFGEGETVEAAREMHPFPHELIRARATPAIGNPIELWGGKGMIVKCLDGRGFISIPGEEDPWWKGTIKDDILYARGWAFSFPDGQPF